MMNAISTKKKAHNDPVMITFFFTGRMALLQSLMPILFFVFCSLFFGKYHPVTANLLQLCEQIDHFKQFKWSAGCLEFADYGCFCGPGGWGEPADDVDACCMVHDHCYEKAMKKFEFCYPYVSYYHHKGGKCGKQNPNSIGIK